MSMDFSRRSMLGHTAGYGAVAASASAYPRLARGQAAASVVPITMVINQSPWFEGFRRLVEKYQDETGNSITLDVNPYAGALEKIRNSLRASDGSYDLLAIDNNWMVEFFDGGFLLPLDELDPGFNLDSGLNTYDGTIFWNEELRTFDPTGGQLMGSPINGNVDVLFYRTDLYEEKGLQVPETWDDLLQNTIALNDPPDVYGFVHRDDRGSAFADFVNYMFSFGGELFADARSGDFTVVMNSPTNLEALEYYLELGEAGGYPTPGSVGQGQLIEFLAAGKAAQVITVVGAWATLEDPTRSAVPGKINAALIPRSANGRHASRSGHWVGAIARNVPRERQIAALEFLKWFGTYENQLDYTRFGAVPVHLGLADSALAEDPRFRFLGAQVANSAVARMYAVVPEAAQVADIASLRLNECIIGQTSPAEALNIAAAEIHDVVRRGGHRTGRLGDL